MKLYLHFIEDESTGYEKISGDFVDVEPKDDYDLPMDYSSTLVMDEEFNTYKKVNYRHIFEEQERQKQEDIEYGSYEDQVRMEYNAGKL